MQTQTTHTSREIAQAIVDRLMPRYPEPVALDPRPCHDCNGEGIVERIVGGWDIPRTREETCRACDGAGLVTPHCLDCREDATTEIFDNSPYSPVLLCDEHALDTRHLDGLDFVVAFALRVLP